MALPLPDFAHDSVPLLTDDDVLAEMHNSGGESLGVEYAAAFTTDSSNAGMTVASLVQTAMTTALYGDTNDSVSSSTPITNSDNDFNFTDAGVVNYLSVLTPLESFWTVFPLVFMSIFLLGWLLREKFWFIYGQLEAALGIDESQRRSTRDLSGCIPTEVSSAKLLRATKSELDLAGVSMTDIDELKRGSQLETNTRDFVTIKL